MLVIGVCQWCFSRWFVKIGMPGFKVSKQNIPLWWDKNSSSGQWIHRYLTNSVSHRWSEDKWVAFAAFLQFSDPKLMISLQSNAGRSKYLQVQSKASLKFNNTKYMNHLKRTKQTCGMYPSYLFHSHNVTFRHHESYNKRPFWHSAFIQLLLNFSKIKVTQTNGEVEDHFILVINWQRIVSWKARLE